MRIPYIGDTWSRKWGSIFVSDAIGDLNGRSEYIDPEFWQTILFGNQGNRFGLPFVHFKWLFFARCYDWSFSIRFAGISHRCRSGYYMVNFPVNHFADIIRCKKSDRKKYKWRHDNLSQLRHWDSAMLWKRVILFQECSWSWYTLLSVNSNKV